jgi:excisionase family DNA binding protein
MNQSTSHTCNCRGIAPLLIQRKQAAAMLGITLRSVDYLLADGRLRSRRIGGRVLIPMEELKRFAAVDRRERLVPSALGKLANAA